MSYVTVWVWVSRIKKRSPGHAALAIMPGAAKPAEGYVSFAPQESGSIRGPGKFYSSEDDKRHYFTPDDDGPRGLYKAMIFGLDTAAMLRQFQRDQELPQLYSPLNECATNVHRYLKLGGGDRYASWWSRNLIVPIWSPDDVEDYARSIVKGTRHLGSSDEKIAGAGTIF
jgi:hypothetical protein